MEQQSMQQRVQLAILREINDQRSVGWPTMAVVCPRSDERDCVRPQDLLFNESRRCPGSPPGTTGPRRGRSPRPDSCRPIPVGQLRLNPAAPCALLWGFLQFSPLSSQRARERANRPR